MSDVRSNRVRKNFLDALEKGYSLSRAASEAGHPIGFFKAWKRDDADFSQDWDDAIESGTDRLEDRARDRAMRDSDGLMTFLLRARRPDKYRERSSVEHTGTIELTGAREKLAARLASLSERRGKTEVPSKSD